MLVNCITARTASFRDGYLLRHQGSVHSPFHSNLVGLGSKRPCKAGSIGPRVRGARRRGGNRPRSGAQAGAQLAGAVIAAAGEHVGGAVFSRHPGQQCLPRADRTGPGPVGNGRLCGTFRTSASQSKYTKPGTVFWTMVTMSTSPFFWVADWCRITGSRASPTRTTPTFCGPRP